MAANRKKSIAFNDFWTIQFEGRIIRSAENPEIYTPPFPQRNVRKLALQIGRILALSE